MIFLFATIFSPLFLSLLAGKNTQLFTEVLYDLAIVVTTLSNLIWQINHLNANQPHTSSFLSTPSFSNYCGSYLQFITAYVLNLMSLRGGPTPSAGPSSTSPTTLFNVVQGQRKCRTAEVSWFYTFHLFPTVPSTIWCLSIPDSIPSICKKI